MRKIAFIIILAVLLSGCALPSLAPKSSPEEEYYRGVFDVCAAITSKPADCLDWVKDLRENKWYEDDSPGWRWPLPASTVDGPTEPGLQAAQ